MFTPAVIRSLCTHVVAAAAAAAATAASTYIGHPDLDSVRISPFHVSAGRTHRTGGVAPASPATRAVAVGSSVSGQQRWWPTPMAVNRPDSDHHQHHHSRRSWRNPMTGRWRCRSCCCLRTVAVHACCPRSDSADCLGAVGTC
uniref:Putative secreted protein n=1 Tax=Anopheles marajoara TaxID=58244 RepID=A0A2M4C738_9DIPT